MSFRHQRTVLLVSGIALASLGSVYAQDPAATPRHSSPPALRYNHGHLITVSTQQLVAGVPNVALYDEQGHAQAMLSFAQNDAVTVQLLFGFGLTDTRVLASGRARKRSGGITQFIAAQNTDGSHRQILHTGHFLATQACESWDGTLWAVGKEMPFTTKALPLLRHMTFTGRLLGSYLQASSLNSYYSNDHGTASMYLSCKGNDVFFYDGPDSLIGLYDGQGGGFTSLPVKAVSDPSLGNMGFGMDDDGTLYSRWGQPGKSDGRVYMRLAMARDKKGAGWLPVASSKLFPEGVSTQLVGVEHGSIILSDGVPSHGVRRVHLNLPMLSHD